MKAFARILVVLLLAVMVFGMIPSMESSADAAGNPIMVINPTTAVNPILDHKLDFNTFSSGGPFTVTFDWKCDLQLNDPSKGEYFASVIVEGTVYGSTTQTQVYPGYRINGKTGWQTKSFQFQNVGVYNVSGSNLPGGVLRFYVLYAKGEFQIRNLTIKNAAGTVLYNLNTDPIVAQAMTNMRNQGMSEIDMSELAAIDYENCPWVAGQFATGAYSCFLREDSSSTQTTTSSITRPSTTKPPVNTTQPPVNTTQPPVNTTKPPVNTTQPPVNTTKPPVQNTTKNPGVTDPCAKGHNYVNGSCTRCGITQPGYLPPVNTTVPPVDGPSAPIVTNPPILDNNTTVPTQAPTPNVTQPSAPSQYDDGGSDQKESGPDYTLILIVMAVIMCSGVFILIVLLLIKMSKSK